MALTDGPSALIDSSIAGRLTAECDSLRARYPQLNNLPRTTSGIAVDPPRDNTLLPTLPSLTCANAGPTITAE